MKSIYQWTGCSVILFFTLTPSFAQSPATQGPNPQPTVSGLLQQAQPNDAGPPPNQDPNVVASSASSDLWRYLTSYEFALALLVLGFGVLVVLAAHQTLKGISTTPEQVLRFYGVIVILVGTILLIVAGLNNNQIAPAIGLFGTLAGYLLGRHQSADSPPSTSNPPPGSKSDEPQK